MQDGKHPPTVSQELFDRLLNSTEDNQPAKDKHDKQDHLPPQTLETSLLDRGLRLSLDLIIASMALCYAIFGFLVYKSDGTSAAPGSTGLKLLEVSRYAPTIFPVLFAATIGGGMRSIASWRIQSRRGATVGMLRAFNFLGILSVSLWCLSPVGSQASLRVITVTTSTTSSTTSLVALNTSSEYRYSDATGLITANTKIINTVVASLMAAPLLANRNQDLWGNIRIPAIERLENGTKGTSGWIAMPRSDNMTYSSLLGMPVKPLPSLGNTSFILPGSYLSISCPVFGLSSQANYTDYTAPSALSPNNGYDCRWATGAGGTQYQIAISAPCSRGSLSTSGATRNASRKLIWESYSGRNSYSRAECELSTTFVDAHASCTGSSSGSSSGSSCDLSSVRRSTNPPFPRDWTVFDLGRQLAVDGILTTCPTFPLFRERGCLSYRESASLNRNGPKEAARYAFSPAVIYIPKLPVVSYPKYPRSPSQNALLPFLILDRHIWMWYPDNPHPSPPPSLYPSYAIFKDQTFIGRDDFFAITYG
ncbi:hypothetical protein VFPPC_16148 [Pochonia chlamydosporia 170]|uniref:Uncharacterized protein n=1 Tax=Pochonia chlamydosporia 170 TaxID=1380566 RepID=A0A179FF65_METCM|nr:hypothetical protein VFPPC_16148 [Pochonia chlamydosporia 170]OAQ64047.1 hypothetical protein VFPPC_16148 [Pochonia chlamydosporia 170]